MCLKWISCLIFVVAVSGNPLGNLRATKDDDPNILYRIPKNIMPMKYTIDLVLDDKIFTTESDAFTGTVTIDYEVITNTDTMILHVNKDFLKILSIQRDGVDLSLDTADNKDTNIYSINAEFKVDDLVKSITITYEGRVSTTDMYGFYKSSYSEKNSDGSPEEKFLVTTQFQTIHARRVFPCFDEPSFKATFLISITYPKNDNLVALANTKGVKAEENDE